MSDNDRAVESAVGENDKRTDPCKFLFKKSTKRFHTTNRREKKSSSDEEDDTPVVRKQKRKHTPNLLKQSTMRSTQDKVDYSSSDDGESESAPSHFAYRTSGTGQRIGPSDMGATATLDIETERDRDAQAVFERSQAVVKEAKGKAEDKVYKGLEAYGQGYVEKKDTAQGNASSGMVRRGPIRAPEHLRATIRWDYQPDICKDYKETGFCGFGDSCKFLHDRSDYKHGWQLERDWQNKQKAVQKARAKKNRDADSNDEADDDDSDDADPHKYEISDSDDDEKMPFKCFMCRESFKDPVVTKCKHYFCEKCALEQYRKSQRCFVCGQQTNGVFNPAKELMKKMQQHQLAAKAKAEENDSS